jgi:demethylmenaquinone methyltransferase/2-methoxy-6-polyprenyl-1,4-benzoquinol methylase
MLPSQVDKPRFVARMFGRIAGRYDLMNTLMTAGQDRVWRERVAERVGAARDVLDLGTGTAKLAMTLAQRLPRARIIGVDFAEPMLRAAKEAPPLVAADAVKLPFADNRFDAVTSAFLMRNLADISMGILEQVRVLRPGGRLVILETTPGPPSALPRMLFRLYFRQLVPLLGKLIAGDAAAYTYLPESSAHFLEPERLARLLAEHGLQDVQTQKLALGTVAITSARR